MTLELDVKKHIVELQNKKKIKLSESKLLNLSNIFTCIAFKSTDLNVAPCYCFLKRYRATQLVDFVQSAIADTSRKKNTLKRSDAI